MSHHTMTGYRLPQLYLLALKGDCRSYTRAKKLLEGAKDELSDAESALKNSEHSHAAEEEPLFAAIKGQSVRIADLFLNHGADMSIQDDRDRTPLLWAVDARNVCMVDRLLEQSSGHQTLEHADNRENTPLLRAVCNLDYDMVEFLLYKNANVNVCGGEGSAAMLTILAIEDLRQLTDKGPCSFLKERRKKNALRILKTPTSKKRPIRK